jgi:hypothetical protein
MKYIDSKFKTNQTLQIAGLTAGIGSYICAGFILSVNFYYGAQDFGDWIVIWINAFVGALASLYILLNDFKNWSKK